MEKDYRKSIDDKVIELKKLVKLENLLEQKKYLLNWIDNYNDQIRDIDISIKKIYEEDNLWWPSD